MAFKILDEREGQVARTRKGSTVVLDCNRASVAGSVSQRACTFCGSRVVLYPIADALHLVHGPPAVRRTRGIFAAPCRRGRSCIESVVRPICASATSCWAARRGWSPRFVT